MAPIDWLLFMCLIFSLSRVSRAELWAHYIRSPESITVPLGDEVGFVCQTDIRVEKVVWWYRQVASAHNQNPQWIEIDASLASSRPNSPYHISNKPASSRNAAKSVLSKLTINFQNKSLAGEYRCVSWNGASGLSSISGKLSVAWIDSAPEVRNQKLIVAPDTLVFIRCPPPASEPPPMMIYYRMVDGSPKEIDNGIINKGLLIRPDDAISVYTCAARNPLTYEINSYAHRITVEVQNRPDERPSFMPSMSTEVTGKVGKMITLICEAVGHPAPRIQWSRKDGLPLPRHSTSNSSILYINHLHAHDHGDYVCTASNRAGESKKEIHLLVWQAAGLSPEKNNGEKIKDEEIVQEGGSIRLSCGRASGEPAPTFYWLINGNDVANDSSIKVMATEIEIHPVEKKHAGVVQCFAMNDLGSGYTGSLLKVLPKQHMTQVSDDGNKPQGRHRGRFKGGNRKVMIPPSRPNVTRLSDESVMVRWAVNNTGLSIVFFKVQYKDLNATTDRGRGGRDSNWKTLDQTILPHVHSHEVGGLTPEHYYKFRIAAVYSNDDNKKGPNSVKFLLQRGADLPKAPLAPVLNRTEAVSTTSIRLYWQLENDMEVRRDTPAIEGFYIHYRPTSTAGDYSKEAVEGGDTRTHLLTSLTPGAQYEIKLQSFTRTVPSTFSAIMIQGTLKPPIIEQPNEIDNMVNVGSGIGSTSSTDNIDQVYVIAGGAAGATLLIVVFVYILILCKKRKADGAGDKQNANNGSVGRNSTATIEGLNGYHAAPPAYSKPSITITSNPLHTENENVDMEMSYMSVQNNNCSTVSPHSSIELSSSIPSSCREEMRKQSPLPSMSPRENYV